MFCSVLYSVFYSVIGFYRAFVAFLVIFLNFGALLCVGDGGLWRNACGGAKSKQCFFYMV